MVVDTSLAVPKADSRAGVHALLAIDKLSVNTKAQLMVSRSHPDVNFRLKRGHAMLQQVSFAFMLGLFCLYTRRIEPSYPAPSYTSKKVPTRQKSPSTIPA